MSGFWVNFIDEMNSKDAEIARLKEQIETLKKENDELRKIIIVLRNKEAL